MGLTVREQELVILRIALHYDCNYVWNHHVPVAMEFGINQTELDAAWGLYKKELTDGEMVDLISLVSQYVFFALTNNVLRVAVEQNLDEIESLR